MSDRRRDIAVMRSLGARRSTVLSVILLESILLSLGGGAAGWLLGHGLIAAAGPWVLKHTGFAMGALQFSPWELGLVPGLVMLATLVGYLPALAAYRTDVAKALSAAP
jgi:putative ABC transport system permease protein